MAKKNKPPAGDAGDPTPNSPADLGYSKDDKGEKPMDPEQVRQLKRLAREIARATKDVEAKASARGSASQALQEAQKGLKKLIAEQNAVVAGTWVAGMFDEDEDDGADGGDDDNDE